MVPEPEHKEEGEHIGEPIQVGIGQQPGINSSDDETGDEDDNVDGVMNGYMPLPQVQNDDDDEIAANQLSGSDEETENVDELPKESDREIHVNQDLVMSTMKGVSLSRNCIPVWAKELSDNEWNNIVKRTINGENVSAKQNSPG